MVFVLYLNDAVYGKGPLSYIKELIDDYLTHSMEHQEAAEFRIVQRKKKTEEE